ncbi:MAG: permease prefix domain 1-containing protein [Emergencia sp.]|nr:permease prefix domain 1-containing protein [Emergencia sp.]
MEIIINYLDSMFASLPNTEEVRKAKAEMASMMEDKYTELKAEGKSENEAIGTVISEFGSIEELAGELGLGHAEESEKEPNLAAETQVFCKTEISENRQKSSLRKVSMTQCREYLDAMVALTKNIAAGVVLCILSPMVPVLFSQMFSGKGGASLGTIGMFVMIAAAVALFIINGIGMQKFEHLKTEAFELEAGAAEYLQQMRSSEDGRFAGSIALGVILCICSIFPPILSEGFLSSEASRKEDFAAVLMFLLIACGVYLFITAGIRRGCYNVLLQQGEYSLTSKQRERGAAKISEKIAGVYWPLVTAVYLGWSLFSGDWDRTWMIWPIAGLVFAAIAAVCGLIGFGKTED